MQKTVLMWFWWSKVIWSDAAFWLRMEKDSAAVFFREPGAKSCECMISVHREVCCYSRSEH